VFIYKITNNVNNKFYIGKTTMSIERRFQHHKRCKQPEKMVLEKAILKYGKENFTIKCIDIANNLEELNLKEIEYIKNLKPNYNVSPGGTGGALFLGKKHTEESKNKIRQKRIGAKVSMETREKMKNSSPRTKLHTFINPEGLVKQIYNLEDFCKKHNFHSSGFRKLQKGEIGHYKNYRRISF